jgi:hypothetical protein
MKRSINLIVAVLIAMLLADACSAMGPVEVGSILVASFIGILLFWFIIFFLFLAGAIFWVWMFIDCLTRENYRDQNDKVVWVIVLLLASILGAVLYFFLVKRRLGNRPVSKARKRHRK